MARPPTRHTDPAEELPRVTAAHLRRAEELCPRRLAGERTARRGGARNRAGDARFAVSNRLEGDIRIAHATMRSAEITDFPEPGDLMPEQRQVYRAAAHGYLALFTEPACSVGEEIVDGFATEMTDPGVVLMGGIGIPVTLEDASAELRVARVGERGFGRPLLDDLDLEFAMLRLTSWPPRGTVRIVAADVLGLERQVVEVELEAARAAARAHLAERLARIEHAVSDPRPRAGTDCSGCGFVAGCAAHQAAP